jgi:hypothetical protein
VTGGASDCDDLTNNIDIINPSEETTRIKTFAVPNKTANSDATSASWISVQQIFKTGAAGNYVLGLVPRNSGNKSQNQFLYGDFVLKTTTVPEATAYYNSVKTEVEGDYDADANGGAEKTDFKNALDANVSGYNTVAQLMEAAASLYTLRDAFIAATPKYDALVAINTLISSVGTLSYADSKKKPSYSVTAASASEADEKTASQTLALRAYYESHALAEGVDGAVNMTSRIANPNAEDGNNSWNWTGTKNEPKNNEPWTDANGTSSHTYFDGGNWNGSNWTTTMSQTISLPAGKYLLTAKGRAATNTTLTMAVGNESVALPNIGSAGNVFGRGWGDGSVEFTTDGSDVEILVTATASPTHEWFSISQFRLVKLAMIISESDTYVPEAGENKSVILERSFNKGWNAVCLPFALTREQLTAQFGEVEVAEFSGEEGTGAVTLQFTRKTDGFAKNTPYLVYFPSAVDANMTFEGVTVDPDDVLAEGTAFDFKGVYKVTDIEAGNWVISGGELKKASQTISLKPTRTYFEPKAAGARIAGFVVDGDENTAIKAVMAQEGMPVEGIYNLQGQRVEKATKGIYVVNGKKVVRK